MTKRLAFRAYNLVSTLVVWYLRMDGKQMRVKTYRLHELNARLLCFLDLIKVWIGIKQRLVRRGGGMR